MLQQTRFAWYLLAPAAILLVVLLVLPIIIMMIYTFYEFVTAGVEKETTDPKEVYESHAWKRTPYQDGWLPDL